MGPCNAAFTEKKITVMVGPKTACPKIIFCSVVMRSRFGRTLETKLNQKCNEGPKIIIPYPAIRNVLTKSYGSDDCRTIVWQKMSMTIRRRTNKKFPRIIV